MAQQDFRPDINFLFEMGNIRYIERMWRRFLGTDFANVAEHHFRVFWIAMVIAAHESDRRKAAADTGNSGGLTDDDTDVSTGADPEGSAGRLAAGTAADDSGPIDTGKIAKLCLLHDITESRVGEVDYISRQYTGRSEELAIEDMLEGTAVREEFLALWHEYEDRKSVESRIVKDADNLDVDFELAEQAARGSQLKDIWRPMRREVADTKLYTETARRMYEQLQAAGPHDWHWTSVRNRLNGGDWRK